LFEKHEIISNEIDDDAGCGGTTSGYEVPESGFGYPSGKRLMEEIDTIQDQKPHNYGLIVN